MLVLRNGSAALANQMYQLSPFGAQLVASDHWRRIMSIRTVRGNKADMMMNGLRVYTNGATVEARSDGPIFYSRRDDGPYYRWSFDDKVRQWRVGRVLKSGVSAKTLSPAPWKVIPIALQKSMAEHYQD